MNNISRVLVAIALSACCCDAGAEQITLVGLGNPSTPDLSQPNNPCGNPNSAGVLGATCVRVWTYDLATSLEVYTSERQLIHRISVLETSNKELLKEIDLLRRRLEILESGETEK